MRRACDRVALLLAVGLLLAGGIAKWLDPLGFQAAILGQVRLPLALAGLLALLLPAAEIVLGAALLPRASRRLAAVTSSGLVASFVLWKFGLLATGFAGDCGCFGGLLRLPLPWSLVLDLALLAACLRLVLVREPGPAR